MTNPSAGGRTRYRVEAAESGMRLDKLLAARLPALSRTRLKALIEEGRVSSDGATITDPSRRVKRGQAFAVEVPEPAPAEPRPQEIPLSIVYEDDQVIVIDKPAGLVVHPAPGSREGTLVNALLAHCGESLSGIGGVMRPGIVHRLDKDTSGLLVVAKTDAAHRSLSAQFAKRTVGRAYQALVWGVPTPPAGEIAGAIGRSPRDRKKMAVVTRGGKPAATRYRLRRRFADVASLVECRLTSGRTHQIRVHMAAIGHPVVGDRSYGGRRRRPRGKASAAEQAAVALLTAFPRQALHAYLIRFLHPATGRVMEFSSPLPRDIKELIAGLENL